MDRAHPSPHFAEQRARTLPGMENELSPLERDVLGILLAPRHPVMDALRRQFERCRVASRQPTGVKFFTTLDE